MHLLEYLLKLSISLAVLFIFYRAVLSPLTFYRCNRFYLLCYSLLSFIIPFVNITPWIIKEGVHTNQLVEIIPVIGNYTVSTPNDPMAWSSALQQLSLNQWLVLFFCMGTFVMLARTIYQYLSLRRIRSVAVLLNSGDAVHLYQTTAPVSPFSFGNAIYFNRSLHTEEELQRIIQHEFVHVKQRHSVDILVGELLCIVNWFNPFAWFIRHAIRQNLEFIADNEVVANGINKKEYQYLLLKTVGIPQYSIANNFNFSSLKKRIAMMNKMKSAKLHLTKFLFILPLMVVLLLAFRNKINDNNQGAFVFTGIVYDAATMQPLENVLVDDSCSDLSARTDAHGFFKLHIPVNPRPAFRVVYHLELDGLGATASRRMDFNNRPGGHANMLFAAIHRSKNAANEMVFDAYHQVPEDDNKRPVPDPGYDFVQGRFNAFQHQEGRDNRLITLVGNSKKPIWVIDGTAYAILKDGWASLDNVETEGFKIIVDGKWMTMEEVNASVNRFELSSANASSGKRSVEMYGIDANVLALYRKVQAVESVPSDTVPAPPAPPGPAVPEKTEPKELPAPVQPEVLPPGVSGINIREKHDKKNGAIVKTATVVLKNGQTETYHLNDPKENSAYLEKYGAMPEPPPVPAIAPIPEVSPAPLTVPARQTAPAPVKVAPPAVLIVDQLPAHKPLIVVNGEIKPEGYEIEKISPADVKTLDVLTDKTATDKYGSKGKYGVMEITTIPPLYIVDGVEQGADFKVKSIPPQNIDSMLVSKDINATDKYGDKGKHGVVEIHMKKDIPIPPGVLIILDGRKLPAGAKLEYYIQSTDIKSINILKGKEATDKYGKKAKNGVIIIKSRKLHPVADNT